MFSFKTIKIDHHNYYYNICNYSRKLIYNEILH